MVTEVIRSHDAKPVVVIVGLLKVVVPLYIPVALIPSTAGVMV